MRQILTLSLFGRPKPFFCYFTVPCLLTPDDFTRQGRASRIDVKCHCSRAEKIKNAKSREILYRGAVLE